MQPDARYRAKPHIVSARDDGTVLLDPIRERYYSLSGIGGYIWVLLCDGATRDDVLRGLASHFEIPREQLEKDATEIVNALVASMLVEIDDCTRERYCERCRCNERP